MRRRDGLRVRPSLARNREDPLALLVNVFDCAVVLAIGLALLAHRARTAAADADVPDQRTQMTHYRRSDGTSTGEGTRLGIAYQLANGDVVFVPEPAGGR